MSIITGAHDQNIKTVTSYKQKIRGGNKRAKDIIDTYDLFLGDYFDEDKWDRIEMNHQLYNGTYQYDDHNLHKSLFWKIGGEDVSFDYENIIHYPIISLVAKAMVGEQIGLPFSPRVVGMGSTQVNSREKKQQELIKELLNQELIAPIQQQATMMWMQQNQVEDPYALTMEQQQQMQAEVAQRVQKMTPKDVADYMKYEYRSPAEIQGQKFIDYLLKYLDIHSKVIEGFRHAMISGEEYYYTGVRNGEPVFETVNPKYFTWAGDRNEAYVQNGEYAKYEEWIRYSTVIQRYSNELSRKDIKDLETLIEPFGHTSRRGKGKENPLRDLEHAAYDHIVVNQDYYKEKYGEVDIRTRDGLNTMGWIYADALKRYGGDESSFSNFYVRHTHIVWKDYRYLYRVTRMVDGKKKVFYRDDSYEFDHLKGDIKVQKIVAPEIWEGTKLGTGSPMYVGIRRLPWQYNSIENPFDVKLPYSGGRYNTQQNNDRVSSIVDVGKKFQYEFDVQMSEMKRAQATNIGKVFTMFLDLKPDNWKWNDWLKTVRNSSLMMLNPLKDGLNPQMLNALKSIDLSKVSDISAHLQLLSATQSNIVTSMYYNPARLGQFTSPYVTSTNNNANIQGSTNQTAEMYYQHDFIVSQALTSLLKQAKIAYKDNDFKASIVLDDASRMDLKLDWQVVGPAELGVAVDSSVRSLREMGELRQHMQSLIQTNIFDEEDLINLFFLNTKTEALNMVRKSKLKREEREAQAMQMQQQQQQMAAQMQQQQLEMKAQMEMQKEQLRAQAKLQAAAISAETLANQLDIDRNKVSDSIQKEQLKQQFDLLRHEDEMELKERELDIKEKEVEGRLKQFNKNKN